MFIKIPRQLGEVIKRDLKFMKNGRLLLEDLKSEVVNSESASKNFERSSR